MEEGEKGKDFVSLAIRSALPAHFPPLAELSLKDIGNNVLMRKHYTFWMASRAAAVYQKCQILLGIYFRPAISTGARYVSDMCKVFGP